METSLVAQEHLLCGVVHIGISIDLLLVCQTQLTPLLSLVTVKTKDPIVPDLTKTIARIDVTVTLMTQMTCFTWQSVTCCMETALR